MHRAGVLNALSGIAQCVEQGKLPLGGMRGQGRLIRVYRKAPFCVLKSLVRRLIMATLLHEADSTMGKARAIAGVPGSEAMPWAVRANLRLWRPLPAVAWRVLAGVEAAGVIIGGLSMAAFFVLFAFSLSPRTAFVPYAWVGYCGLLVFIEAVLYCLFVRSGFGKAMPETFGAWKPLSVRDARQLDLACQAHPWLVGFMEARGVEGDGVAAWCSGSADWLVAIAVAIDDHEQVALRVRRQAALRAEEREKMVVATSNLAARIETLRTARDAAQRLECTGAAGQRRRA